MAKHTKIERDLKRGPVKTPKAKSAIQASEQRALTREKMKGKGRTRIAPKAAPATPQKKAPTRGLAREKSRQQKLAEALAAARPGVKIPKRKTRR